MHILCIKSHQTDIYHKKINYVILGGKEKCNELNNICSLPVIPVNEFTYDSVNVRQTPSNQHPSVGMGSLVTL